MKLEEGIQVTSFLGSLRCGSMVLRLQYVWRRRVAGALTNLWQSWRRSTEGPMVFELLYMGERDVQSFKEIL